MRTPPLRIGWAETDTTPRGRVDLSGQYYHRASRGIHSRLSATVLALESGGEQAVMVSLDVVSFMPDFQEELRNRIKPALPDLDVSKVFLNATHTHNAPGVDPIAGIGWLKELPGVLPVREYRKFLLSQLSKAVVAAWKSRRPGGIASALGFARVGHCRRAVYADGTAEMYGCTNRPDFIGMEGGEDSGVDLLFTFDCRKRPTGVVMNLACPAQVMEAAYKVSSDFMGETRRRLKLRFGKTFRLLGQISAAGCQSPRDLTRGLSGEPDFWREDGVREIGRRLEAAVKDAAGRSKVDFSPVVRHRVQTLSLPRRRASEQEAAKAKRALKELESRMSERQAYAHFCAEVTKNERIRGRPGPYDSKRHPFVLFQNNRAVLARHKDQDRRPAFDAECHVVRIGEAVFATNPFELYLDFGHRIKARSPARQTFVVQLCCGTGGYLASARAEQLGGYGGLIINGEVGSGGGELLVGKTLDMISDVWKQTR